jgi:alpha-1,3-glucosyltransferase
LFGIFIFSLCFVQEGKYLLCAVTFAILLNFKHIYLYAAPAYFLFLFFRYCYNVQLNVGTIMKSTPNVISNTFNLLRNVRFIQLGFSVIFVFLLSFGPFVIMSQLESPKPSLLSQIKHILARMFPFERGLTHAYWCPNFWALYNMADKLCIVAAKRIFKMPIDATSQFSGGLVGLNQGAHVLLPTIRPGLTILLSGITAALSCLLVLRKREITKDPTRVLLECILHSSFAFYSFGWHVHEKAIIMILVPLSLLIVNEKGSVDLWWTKRFIFASIVGTYSLFPLLFQPLELPIKWLLLLSYTFLMFTFVSRYTSVNVMFNIVERAYLFGLVAVEIYASIIHDIILPHLSFLPLMIISVYCAFGVSYTWLLLFFDKKK